MSRRLASALANAALVAAPFLLLEGLCRVLPVSDVPPLQAVTEATPVVRYQPDVDYRYSRDWNFSIVTRRHMNNYGFSHAGNFLADEKRPLMAVIGDSFVEANVVDRGKGVAELLDAGAAPAGRVYGISISGAPLSQYLAFAGYARQNFKPGAMAFVIIGNDFDESLLKYKTEPRFHYFDADGKLRRIDYHLSAAKHVLRHSAALRYIMLNLEAQHHLNALRDTDGLSAIPYDSEERIADSKRAVDFFLAQLPAQSGLDARHILFVLDAPRPWIYSKAELAKIANGLHVRLRAYFTEQARARGYEVVDLQPLFIERNLKDGARFEAAPTDSHWNAAGHALAAAEIRKSVVYARTFGDVPAH